MHYSTGIFNSFKNILQELMEAELDSSLGYERTRREILIRTAYIVLGITTEGYKDIISITIGANETSKFWLGS